MKPKLTPRLFIQPHVTCAKGSPRLQDQYKGYGHNLAGGAQPNLEIEFVPLSPYWSKNVAFSDLWMLQVAEHGAQN